MARERRPPSARSSNASNSKQAKDAAEIQDHREKPAARKDDIYHTTALSAGDESNKNDEHQQSSSQAEDNRTFQQLVHDYGDDMLSLNELFHAQPSDGVEVKPETNKGK